MDHPIGDLCLSNVSEKNISGTHHSKILGHSMSVNRSGQPGRSRASSGCSFVVADWRERREPFCAAPTRPGSSYCARHQALCIVPKASPEARLREAVLLAEAEEAPGPPPELAHLAESALPESLPDDPRDLRVLLDHPPPDPGAREPE
jgi:hypothetical protein